ncbi:MAG: ARMT1-like domain-containing protein [Syntrophorhabdaceae bacterium]|nr:ARMT1-like domain-containing protein [Syntrophorhabdaceae bacterium]
MKVTEYCVDCLKGLVERTSGLSGANEAVKIHCQDIVKRMWKDGKTPPAIANVVLRYIKEATGVYDPYAEMKDNEYLRAKDAVSRLWGFFPDTLEGALKFSSLGNSTDIFPDNHGGFSGAESINFFGDIEGIKKEIDEKGRDVLLLGDNIGDFLFDIRLVRFLEERGKRVYYAVKEHPVQNDLSMKDVIRYGFNEIFDNIISTGTDEVGIEEKDIKGIIKSLWEDNIIVIAKGMGNYETISEMDKKRQVIHVMKVKCHAVSDNLGFPKGSYVATIR